MGSRAGHAPARPGETMTTVKIFCPNCGAPLLFRGWSKRYPPKSEALADCPGTCGKWQIRFFDGRQTSEPYQIRTGNKTEVIGGRITKERKAAIVAIYGSIQNFMDSSKLICITQQYIH